MNMSLRQFGLSVKELSVSRQFGRKTVLQRCGWLYVTCSCFCMTRGFDRTGVDCRQVSCELPKCLDGLCTWRVVHK